MPYRVVTIYDDEAGWSRVAVVKTLEEDPSVWGVVGWYATTYAARLDADRMTDERTRLECSHREVVLGEKNRRLIRGTVNTSVQTESA